MHGLFGSDIPAVLSIILYPFSLLILLICCKLSFLPTNYAKLSDGGIYSSLLSNLHFKLREIRKFELFYHLEIWKIWKKLKIEKIQKIEKILKLWKNPKIVKKFLTKKSKKIEKIEKNWKNPKNYKKPKIVKKFLTNRKKISTKLSFINISINYSIFFSPKKLYNKLIIP